MSLATCSRLGGRAGGPGATDAEAGSGGIVEHPEPTSVSGASNVRVHIRPGVHPRYDRRDAKRTPMDAIESVGAGDAPARAGPGGGGGRTLCWLGSGTGTRGVAPGRTAIGRAASRPMRTAR